MKSELLENYRYWRARGMGAGAAHDKAKWELKLDPPRRHYGACEPSIKYNPPNDEGERWIENASNGLRRIGFVDEICRNEGWRIVEHKGWFTDPDGYGEVNRGIVYRLPHGRFAYGYDDPNVEGSASLVFAPEGTDLSDAVRWADHMAERDAETERNYQEAWQKGRDYYERLPEDIGTVRRKFLKLAVATRRNRDGETVSWLLDLAEEWCGLRKERQDLFNEWSHISGFKE